MQKEMYTMPSLHNSMNKRILFSIIPVTAFLCKNYDENTVMKMLMKPFIH